MQYMIITNAQLLQNP